jgi:hypothetical protein
MVEEKERLLRSHGLEDPFVGLKQVRGCPLQELPSALCDFMYPRSLPA